MTSTVSPIPVSEHGWRSGLVNLLLKESRWWRSSWLGLGQVLLWAAILNGIYALVLFTMPEDSEDGIEVFVAIAAGTSGYGAITLAQGVLVSEKRAGTLAWVLAGPVSRSAIVLSKLIVLVIGSLVTMLLVPGLIAFGETALIQGDTPAVGPVVGGLAIVEVGILFYLSLTVMLGTIFASRGPVIGIALSFIFIGPFLSLATPDWFEDIMPWRFSELVADVAQGEPLATPVPVIACVGWSILFVALSLWRIRRDDL